jgi:ATP-dependent Lon protease
VTDAALLNLIENYCREAGVRNLQKQIEKIYRKVCFCIFMFPKDFQVLMCIFPPLTSHPCKCKPIDMPLKDFIENCCMID